MPEQFIHEKHACVVLVGAAARIQLGEWVALWPRKLSLDRIQQIP
jgi:hypothetical protein